MQFFLRSRGTWRQEIKYTRVAMFLINSVILIIINESPSDECWLTSPAIYIHFTLIAPEIHQTPYTTLLVSIYLLTSPHSTCSHWNHLPPPPQITCSAYKTASVYFVQKIKFIRLFIWCLFGTNIFYHSPLLQNREMMEKLEELETSHNHLLKRLDKLKNAKSALLKDLWSRVSINASAATPTSTPPPPLPSSP